MQVGDGRGRSKRWVCVVERSYTSIIYMLDAGCEISELHKPKPITSVCMATLTRSSLVDRSSGTDHLACSAMDVDALLSAKAEAYGAAA